MSLVFVLCLLHQAVTLGNQQLCSQVTGLIKNQGCDFYNETTLSREAQLTAGIFINHFQPLFRSNCSSFSRILVCSTFAPLCVHPFHRLQPCRHLCHHVKSSCLHLFISTHTAWPSTLNCSVLPSPPQLCISPPSSSSSPVSVMSSSTLSLLSSSSLVTPVSANSSSSLRSVMLISSSVTPVSVMKFCSVYNLKFFAFSRVHDLTFFSVSISNNAITIVA